VASQTMSCTNGIQATPLKKTAATKAAVKNKNWD